MKNRINIPNVANVINYDSPVKLAHGRNDLEHHQQDDTARHPDIRTSGPKAHPNMYTETTNDAKTSL